tara:strand:- start:101 stop:1489 length:1389 start_codon:yes stop_codon:yes gene_type:complete
VSKTNDNLWILFEERPKLEVIKKILQIYAEDNNYKFDTKNIQIRPIFKNNNFQFYYEIENFKISNIEKIYLFLVSGYSSFVDFLLFKSKTKPSENDNLKKCLYGIEETKTDSSESRNTAAGQRGTKFIFLDYFKLLSSNSDLKKLMMYNNLDTQNEVEAESVKFIKRCLITNGIKFYGDYSDNYKKFQNIDELINSKNNLRQPPKGNTPVRLTKKNNIIEISGILSKPSTKGNIGHDPNQGQLITISDTLRKLGWQKKILITKHKVKQNYINKARGNKFMFAMKILNIELEKIDTPQIDIPKNYWYYENTGEKVASILLHLICDYLNFKSIYENHAGSERGYFYTSNRTEIVVNKKYNGENINLPDYVFSDEETKTIFICEGEMFSNYKKGIAQLEGFDLFINLYIKKYFPKYKIIKSIILSDANSNKCFDKTIFQLNTNGKIVHSNSLPKKIIEFLNENHN